MKVSKLAILLPLFCALASCDSNNSADETSDAQTPDNASSDNIVVTNSSSVGRYDGYYASDCIPDGSDSNVVTMDVDDDTATEIRTRYSDSNCTQDAIASTWIYDISFPGGTNSSGVEGADNIDMQVKSYIIDGVNFDYASNGTSVEYNIILLDGITLQPGERPVNIGNSSESRNATLSPLLLTRQ